MRRETTITIAPDHPALAGHFPGTPIVPGVVLLDQVLVAIQSASGVTPGSCRIASAKFFHPVGPGVTLTIGHETLANGAIAFDVMDGPRKVAGGSVLIPRAGAGSRE
jgi:3-hydroxyacyl-[acyl-carrier-protein] dehydratase